MSVLGGLAMSLVPRLRVVHKQVKRYAASWEEANRLALSGEGRLWVVLGDSTAQGIGAPSWDEGYVGQLCRALDAGADHPWRVVNLSKSGARAADVVAKQLPRLEAMDPAPDLVTCAIGANDMVHRTPEPAMEAALAEIMARMPAGSLMATLPKGLNPPRTEATNRFIRAEAPKAGLRVADVWAHTGPPWHGKMAPDGFHPGALGYADWAAAFAEVLGLPPAQP